MAFRKVNPSRCQRRTAQGKITAAATARSSSHPLRRDLPDAPGQQQVQQIDQRDQRGVVAFGHEGQRKEERAAVVEPRVSPAFQHTEHGKGEKQLKKRVQLAIAA